MLNAATHFKSSMIPAPPIAGELHTDKRSRVAVALKI
jgi:hypothetical protein